MNKPLQKARRGSEQGDLSVAWTKLFDKAPPAAPEAEMAVLGSIIIEPRMLPLVHRKIRPRHMHNQKHELIYQALIDVCAKNAGECDMVLLIDALRNREVGQGRSQYDFVGGTPYLQEIVEGVPAPTNAEYFADIVAQKARLRAVIEECGQLIWDVQHRPDEANEKLSKAVESLARISRGEAGRAPVLLGSVATEVIASLHNGRSSMLLTGVEQFDAIAGGVPASGVVTCYGYPASGKTTFMIVGALNIACGIGGLAERPVRVCSYEQGPQRVTATLLSSWGKVNVHRLMNRGDAPSAEEVVRLEAAARAWDGLDFGIWTENMDPHAMFAECQAITNSKGPGVLVVDYIQDVPPFGEFTEANARISESMRILARIANDLKWLVLVVSQLGKVKGEGANRRPGMSDALGSSAIEQRSDMIISVWRPDQHVNVAAGLDAVQAERAKRIVHDRRARTIISVIKFKYGGTGSCEVYFDAPVMTYRAPTAEESRAWPELEERR